MNTVTKIGIAAGAVALLVWGLQAAKKAIGGFSFDVVGYGKPQISGSNITVPLQIKYTNPTPLPINVDLVHGDIYLSKNGAFVKAAVVDQAVNLQPGTSTQWVLPVVDLNQIFGGDWIQTTAFLADIARNKAITIRSDVRANYGGIPIPTQSFTNKIDLA